MNPEKFMPLADAYQKNNSVDVKTFYASAKTCALIANFGVVNLQRIINDYAQLCAEEEERAELDTVRLGGVGFV